MSESDAEFFRKRGFGLKMGFGARPALIVVDLVNGFTNPDLPLGSNLDAEIEATTQLITAAREARIPIIYTTIGYDEDMADSGIWSLKQAALLSLMRGSDATELDQRLGRRPDEAILVKKYASSFFGTDLVTRLNAAGIDTLVITGCTTSGCVRATAVDAVQYGYRPMIVREAVGDRATAAHEQSLFDLEQKYADVVSLDEVRAYFEGLPSLT